MAVDCNAVKFVESCLMACVSGYLMMKLFVTVVVVVVANLFEKES